VHFGTGKFRENSTLSYSKRILVVEDETLIRMMIVDALRIAGLEVLEAGCADEALAILGGGGATVDLVFADVRMPGTMDGIGLMKVLRETRPELKLAVASGYSPDWPSPDFVDAFIGKPYDIERTVNRIKALVSHGQSA
jgi:CheY-like chemotaxis protein